MWSHLKPEEETCSQTCGWMAHGQHHAVVLERQSREKCIGFIKKKKKKNLQEEYIG